MFKNMRMRKIWKQANKEGLEMNWQDFQKSLVQIKATIVEQQKKQENEKVNR